MASIQPGPNLRKGTFYEGENCGGLQHTVDLALPSHAQIPKIDGVPLRVFWYSEPSLSAGIEVVTIDGVSVRIYSPEKTVADCFKYRNKIGLDVAIEALRTYRERTPKPNFQALAKFAQINRVQRVMRPYLDAVLAAGATWARRSGNDCTTNHALTSVRSRNSSSTSPWSDSSIARLSPRSPIGSV